MPISATKRCRVKIFLSNDQPASASTGRKIERPEDGHGYRQYDPVVRPAKGYVNQRRVLTNRAALVKLLYPESGQPAQAPVIVAERTP